MGVRGPVNKPDAARVRENTPDAVHLQVDEDYEVEIPPADDDWHPIAKRWYVALTRSPQAVTFVDSDWATAVFVAESMSRDLNPQFVAVTEQGEVIHETIPLKGASLTAYLKAFSALLATPGDRLRLRLELDLPAPTVPEGVTDLSAVRESRLA